jgi:hypothetical protein
VSDGTRPCDGQPPGIPAPGPSQPGGHHSNRPGPAAAGPAQPAPSSRATAATVTAYAAAVAAFAYALVSAYWALGGRGLISTVGGYVTQFADQRGAAPVLLALGAAAAKAAGGLLALALVRPWGRVIPRGWLRAGLRHWVSYSSWRRHQMPVSLRPRGARSSHAYIPHRTSIPRS